MGELVEIRSRKPVRCPVCTSEKVSTILWGYPTPDAWEAEERGEIVLGGCVIPPDAPRWECRNCGHAWRPG